MISTLQKIGLLTVFLLAAINASAYDFMSDGLCYNILSEEDRTVEVTYKSEKIDDYGFHWYNSKGYVSGIVSIPLTVIHESITYSVTAIGYAAFQDCRKITQVTIPNSVTVIKDEAFQWCEALTQVTIPSSVTRIGNSAFYSCNLQKVTIPNSVTYIGELAFSASPHFTQVTIPNSVIFLGDAAFACCDGLSEVIIESSLPRIGESMFRRCFGLTQVTIPNSVTTIGPSAFEDCSNLTQLTIPNSVTTIGYGAFERCSNLTQLTIPNSVTTIGVNMFNGCSGLTQVTIPNSVTTIDHYAFCGCSNLTQLTMGISVNTLGREVFMDCTALTTIYCLPNTPPANKEYQRTFNSDVLKNAVLYVPTGCKAAYESVDPWRNFWNIQEFDAAGIKDVAEGDSDLKIAVCDGNITIEGGEESAAIEIYSAAGQLLSRSFERSISGLPKGIYLVRVGNQTSKIAL